MTAAVQARIAQITPNHGAVGLYVQSVSLWAYPFSQEQQSGIKAKIAGMSATQAKATLLKLEGVQSVSVSLTNGKYIPTDVHQIHLLFLQV